MGLLTGFSLISAVEIIYFMVKILWKMIQPKLHGLSCTAANRGLVRLFWICDQQATRMFGVKDVKELPLIGAVC